jgi:7-cyano-7-deazaguanine synthase in queuosine biosynthesis
LSTATDSDLPNTVCLLSGGLDSLIGGIDLLNDRNSVAFVSHHGGGMTSMFQSNTFGALHTHYANRCSHHQFYVVGPTLGNDTEKTMRSRSILFLGLGLAIASILGDHVPVIVPENGLISLNVPLTGSRVGSSSTRTTHPHFISSVQRVLNDLGISNNIELPYRHMTKGEMLANVSNRGVLESTLGFTMSCAHPEVARWDGSTPGIHCGYCLPCLVRRAAVSAAGFEGADAPYMFDARHSITHGRVSDLRAVKMALARNEQSEASKMFRVLEAGPLPPYEVAEFVGVYERGMSELNTYLNEVG